MPQSLDKKFRRAVRAWHGETHDDPNGGLPASDIDHLVELLDQHGVLLAEVEPRVEGLCSVRVNGEWFDLDGPSVAFEQVTELAGKGQHATVSYFGARALPPAGTLVRGESVQVQSGTSFTVTHT